MVRRESVTVPFNIVTGKFYHAFTSFVQFKEKYRTDEIVNFGQTIR